MISENLIVGNPWYWQKSNFDLNIFWELYLLQRCQVWWSCRTLEVPECWIGYLSAFDGWDVFSIPIHLQICTKSKMDGSETPCECLCVWTFFFSYNRSMSSDLRMSVSKRRGAISGQPVQRPGRRNRQPPEEILHLAWQADEMRWRSLVKWSEGWLSTKDWGASGSVGLHIQWFHYPNHIEMHLTTAFWLTLWQTNGATLNFSPCPRPRKHWRSCVAHGVEQLCWTDESFVVGCISEEYESQRKGKEYQTCLGNDDWWIENFVDTPVEFGQFQRAQFLLHVS